MQLSLTTVPVTPFFNSTALPPATSFVWKRRDTYYLITNWHVVTARICETGTNLLKGAARPNKLHALFTIRVGQFEKEGIDIRNT